MIFERGGFCLHKNLPNGLKVRFELFRVLGYWFRGGAFNRVDRVERVEVGGFNHGIHGIH